MEMTYFGDHCPNDVRQFGDGTFRWWWSQIFHTKKSVFLKFFKGTLQRIFARSVFLLSSCDQGPVVSLPPGAWKVGSLEELNALPNGLVQFLII